MGGLGPHQGVRWETVSKFIARRVDGSGRRLALAVSQVNESITDRLLEGARDALLQNGVPEEYITVHRVPGAFELPLACKWLAESGGYDAVLALGAVIRGQTSHFDYICRQAAQGIQQASLETGVPVIFGVLTCETQEQAIERAGGRRGNKGAEAAMAALEMADLADALHPEKDAGKYGREA